MVKPIFLTHHIRFITTSSSSSSSRFFHPFSISKSPLRFLSTTPYPLQYELIINRPDLPKPNPHRRTAKPNSSPEPTQPDSLQSWADDKLLTTEPGSSELDKAKRKYYNKRRKRMYGSDSDSDDHRRNEEQFVELKPEVVELRTLHRREEELYFYDAFSYPWEKDKHYKMVYQLEKKFFPHQCLDKAFLKPGQSNPVSNFSNSKNSNANLRNKKVGVFGGVGGVVEDKDEVGDNKLVFFEENVKGEEDREKEKGKKGEKKVEEFFKGLKKDVEIVEPFFSSRRTGLPPVWDSQHGTVLLINKPKGWTSFTVCGKLRRLVKVKKVGHAGTLDPMATGLLIVCVGKSTKLVDRYQGMIKGYNGVFRLGEATSTWDADSPVIQREPWEHIKDEDIKKSALSFCGEIWQVPPMFSAIKVGGEKMYDKARRGESIELSPRRISIFQFDIERSLDDRQNLIFRVTCSKGTYIRSLCADFGKALGSCAHLTALRRDSIGQYLADDAWDFQELEEAITKTYL
ncbi:unnamed protein product [Trifolium pratense]|uniref:Uncharacterized protein n=1 Tax=Trifolium pratense TaxID=57577 RepID=A0ACB0L9P5_TRIPR|nr:unnamed protein product [Trifolium pratense]